MHELRVLSQELGPAGEVLPTMIERHGSCQAGKNSYVLILQSDVVTSARDALNNLRACRSSTRACHPQFQAHS